MIGSDRRLRVLVTPPDANPYQRLLAHHSKPYGVETEIRFLQRTEGITGPKHPIDVVHLHWIEKYYRGPSRWRAVLGAKVLVSFLRRCRQRGIPIVLTAHNLAAHAPRFPDLDTAVRSEVARLVSAVIFHDDQARDTYREAAGPGNYHVVPHPLFPESLVPQPHPDAAKRYFELDDGVWALFFGRPSKQKGFDFIQGSLDAYEHENIGVVTAGRGCHLPQSRETSRHQQLSYFIPEYELPVLFSAVDAVLLPYRSCTTSGLAILALGFGKPLACSPIFPFTELANRGLAVVEDPKNAQAFARAAREATLLSRTDQFRLALAEFRHGRSWDQCASLTRTVYDLVCAT